MAPSSAACPVSFILFSREAPVLRYCVSLCQNGMLPCPNIQALSGRERWSQYSNGGTITIVFAGGVVVEKWQVRAHPRPDRRTCRVPSSGGPLFATPHDSRQPGGCGP